MTTRTPPRQRDRRLPALSPTKAFVEFSHGRRDWSFPVSDVSLGGLSFVADHPVPELGPETRLDSVLHVGDCEIHGHAIVRHATEHPDLSVHYGCAFYPTAEGDMLKLNGVLAGIDTTLDP